MEPGMKSLPNMLAPQATVKQPKSQCFIEVTVCKEGPTTICSGTGLWPHVVGLPEAPAKTLDPNPCCSFWQEAGKVGGAEGGRCWVSAFPNFKAR